MMHLYNSVVEVQRAQLARLESGGVSMEWTPVSGLTKVPCRLDLNFIRQGKDALPAIEAGRKPDRIGVMFFDLKYDIRAGDRVRTVKNRFGKEPVRGVFEIRATPDEAQDMSSVHHAEVQIIEAINDDSPWASDEILDNAIVDDTVLP